MNLETDALVWSAETYRIFDVDPSAPIDLQTVLSRLVPESVAVVLDVVQRAREGSGDFDYDIKLLLPNGSSKYVHVLAHSERNKDGDQELTGAVQDFTESRMSEEALNEVRSELSYVTRVTSLGVLTASIAHEVNQPLAGIVANASTCLRVLTADPPNLDIAQDTARRMIRDANRAADVIVRLRALFSRQPPSIESIDINDVVSEVIALALSDVQRAGVTIVSDFDANLPFVAAARVQLQQVILNILRNSIEAMAEVSDRPRRITLRTAPSSGGQVQVSVEDSGTGPADIHQIFEPFYTTKAGGMGIGLSVSRNIIENHNGHLWATTNPEHGITVSFSVPISKTRFASNSNPIAGSRESSDA